MLRELDLGEIHPDTILLRPLAKLGQHRSFGHRGHNPHSASFMKNCGLVSTPILQI
ncbi:hypothetical protein SPHINGO8AM_30196 [Sphingomonas sp. 8AM]|nr:hypothetical protein SPHINGO8AM_30196 [Sphingomonas sp. 8AM]